MALDKLVDSGELDNDLQGIADAIRLLASKKAIYQEYQDKEYTPEEMEAALQDIASKTEELRSARGVMF